MIIFDESCQVKVLITGGLKYKFRFFVVVVVYLL